MTKFFIKRSYIFLVIVLYSKLLKADSVGGAYQYDKFSENEKFYFKSIPYYNYEDTDLGKTIVYQKATNKVLYKFNNYLSNESFINNSGKTLITTLYWMWGHEYEKYKNTQLIEFYIKGKKTKKYKIDDLVHDKTKLRNSVSHTIWYNSMFIHNDTFYVYTLEEKILLFDTQNGNLLEKKNLSDLSSRFDFNNRENLPRLRDTVYTNIKYPQNYEFPDLTNGNKFRKAILIALNKREVKEYAKSKYYISLECIIDKKGKCDIFYLRATVDKNKAEELIWKQQISKWVRKQRFKTHLIPENCEKWVFKEYFYLI